MKSLPKGWAEKTIGDVAKLINGDRGKNYPSQDEQLDDGYCLFLNTPNVKHGRFDFTNKKYITESQHNLLRNGTLDTNDIVVTIRGTLGNCAVYTDDIESKVVRINSAMMIVRPFECIDPWYLTRVLSSSSFLQWAQRNHRGSAQPHLRAKDINEYQICFPGLEEQKRIVTKLDEVLAQVDTIKARLDGIPAILKRFRQSVLAAAVSGKLTEEWRGDTDRHWERKSLKKLTSKIGSGSTPRGGQSAYKTEGIPLVRSMNIYSTYIKYDDLAYIDDAQAEKLKNVTIEHEDILLNITGASIGRVNIAPLDFVGGRVNQHVAIVRCLKDHLSPKYLHVVLASPLIQKWILGENYGATRQALTKGMIEELSIDLPSIEEQKEIIRLVDQYFTFADTIEAQVKKAQARVDNLTQSILAKAFRGELVPQDPDDEPAEELLRRIATARKEAEVLAKAVKKAAKAPRKAAVKE